MLLPEKVKEILAAIQNTSWAWMAAFFNTILKEAVLAKASDIHMKIWDEKHYYLMFNVEGDKTIIWKWNRFSEKNEDKFRALLTYTRSQAKNVKTDEIHLPQDGSITQDIDWRQIKFRLSLMPWKYDTYDIVMRILDSKLNIASFDKIPFPEDVKPYIKNILTNFHNGDGWLVLVTWPMWSWKTTTLYSFINYILKNTPGITIKTLEDPVEYEIQGVDQSEIDEEHGYTFAQGLKSILRQNPDVIIVWEIRDKETAVLAIQAALTWHLVISTLHVNSSIEVYERLMDFGILRTMLRQVLKLVICQRLQSQLCSCKVTITSDKPRYPKIVDFVTENIKELFQNYSEDKMQEAIKKTLENFKTANHNSNCLVCKGKGVSWRIPIFDVLMFKDDIVDVFEKYWHKPKNELKQELFRHDYWDLETDLLVKISSWLIDSEKIGLFDS